MVDRLSILTKYLTFVLESAFPAQAQQMQEELAKLKPRRGKLPDPIALNESTGKWEGITEQDMARWGALFPAVDIPGELRKAAAWIEKNPTHRKARYSAYLGRWFGRTQDDHDRKNRPVQRYNSPPSETAEERAARRAASES